MHIVVDLNVDVLTAAALKLVLCRCLRADISGTAPENEVHMLVLRELAL